MTSKRVELPNWGAMRKGTEAVERVCKRMAICFTSALPMLGAQGWAGRSISVVDPDCRMCVHL